MIYIIIYVYKVVTCSLAVHKWHHALNMRVYIQCQLSMAAQVVERRQCACVVYKSLLIPPQSTRSPGSNPQTDSTPCSGTSPCIPAPALQVTEQLSSLTQVKMCVIVYEHCGIISCKTCPRSVPELITHSPHSTYSCLSCRCRCHMKAMNRTLPTVQLIGGVYRQL